MKADPNNPFVKSGRDSIYDQFVEQAGASNYRTPLAFSVSYYVAAHGNDPEIAAVWKEQAREIPGDGRESAAVRLLALTTQALRNSDFIEPVQGAVDNLATALLSNGGPFGVDFEHTATGHSLDVMIEALVLSGARVVDDYADIGTVLKDLEVIYLKAPHPPRLSEGNAQRLEGHLFSCFAIAAYGLVGAAGGEEAVLAALPRGVTRNNVVAVWDQFAVQLGRKE